MLDHLLVEHCSPTLSGLKAANLFNMTYDSITMVEFAVAKANELLNKKGVYLRILRDYGTRCLVYVYRPERIAKIVANREVQRFLAQYGYETFTTEASIRFLEERLLRLSEFPHEIGIFLDYPLVDVKGFLADDGRECICTGQWRVYGNADETTKKFERFAKCRRIYRNLFHASEKNIFQLTVAGAM